MEEVQKNEMGTTVPETDGRPLKEEKPKRELTPQQAQQRKKMIVFPLMFLAFAGCMYLIFVPSSNDGTKREEVGGFNADIPLPTEDGIIADKQKAYEAAQLERKQREKMKTLQDFGFTLGDQQEAAELELIPESEEEPQNPGGSAYRGGSSSVRASADAYRNINQQLSTFYETPKEDKEKEELKRQVEELTAKLEDKEKASIGVDDQMAILEKSYELAAKYNLNGEQKRAGGAGCTSRDNHPKTAGLPGTGSTGKHRFRIAAADERCRIYTGIQPKPELRFQYGSWYGLRNGKEHDSCLHTPRPNPDRRTDG